MKYKLNGNFIPKRYSKLAEAKSLQTKIDSLHTQLSIPSNETILYVLGSVTFTGLYAVMTDFAFYTKAIGRLPYSDICSFIVSQPSPRAAVSIVDADHKTTLLYCTLLAKNIVGTELVQLVKELQSFLLNRYAWAREKRNAMAERIFAAAKAEAKKGELSESSRFLLNQLAEEAAYHDEAVLLTAESIFRSCDEAAYRSFAEGASLSHNARRRLDEKAFADRLSDDLSDCGVIYSEAALKKMYENLTRKQNLSDHDLTTLIYVCIRLNKDEQLSSVLPLAEQRLGMDRVKKLRRFRACYYNLRMEPLFDLIKNGVMPPLEQLGWTDSMGLTPLHYAIILHQDELIEKLVEGSAWRKESDSRLPDDKSAVYDYAVAACCVGSENRQLICQKTSAMIYAQLKSQKALERKLFMKESKLMIQNKAYNTTRDAIKVARRNRMYDKEQQLREQAEELRFRIETTREEINEVKQTISDIKGEIDYMTQNAMLEALTKLEKLKAGKDPFVVFILFLYQHPDYLGQVLASPKTDCWLYIYQNIIFPVPAGFKIDLPLFDGDFTRGQESKKNGQEHHEASSAEKPIVKPYGDSWFSPEAHRSIQKLRAEYKALAKLYHPDVCRHPNSKEIFQDILDEQARLLENMAQS